jgi:hypothetical protein
LEITLVIKRGHQENYKRPLGIVYVKSSQGQLYKVKKYADIKPLEEAYKKKQQKVCMSLEEWAMSILKLPVQN